MKYFIKFLNIYYRPLGLFFLLVIFFILPNRVFATCSGLVSPYKCDASTISLSFPSNSVHIGDQVTFVLTFNPNNTGVNIPASSFQKPKTVAVLNGANVIKSQDLAASSNNTVTFDPVTIGGQWFTNPGDYTIQGVINLDCFSNGLDGQSCTTFDGPDIKLTVLAGSNSGPATLSLDSGTKSMAISSNSTVNTHFTYTFSPGGTGAQPSTFLFYCDFQNDESKGFDKASNGFFNCLYPLSPAKSYSVFLKALDSSNKTIAGATATQTLQITGNEASQGSQTIGPGTGGTGSSTSQGPPATAGITYKCLGANPDPVHCLFNPIPQTDIKDILINIMMKGFLSVLAVWSVAFIVIGGFKMTISQGNEEAYTSAKKTITWAILGFIIAMLGFSLIAIVQNFIGADVKNVNLNPPAASTNK